MPRTKKQKDEFAAFLANPQALQCGGPAVQTLRRGGASVRATQSRQQWGLLERLAQAEINRFWQAEIAAKSRKVVMPRQRKQKDEFAGSLANPQVLLKSQIKRNLR